MNRPTNEDVYRNHRDLQTVDAIADAIKAQQDAVGEKSSTRTTSATTSLSIEDAVAKAMNARS